MESLFAPVRYEEPRKLCVSTAMVWILGALTVLWLLRTHPSLEAWSPASLLGCQPISARLAYLGHMAQRVSARVVNIVSTSDMTSAYESKTCAAITEPVSNLVACDVPNATVDADAWRSATASDKDLAARKLRAALASHAEVALMIFAPWCPHCHDSMPRFAEAAKKHPHKLFVIANAEALPPDTFAGEGALFKCQYFPTFVDKGEGGAMLETTVEELDAAAAGASVGASVESTAPPPPIPSGEAEATTEAATEATTEAMFARLFA